MEATREALKPRADWQMPPKPIERCPYCEEGGEIVPHACDTGDGWSLSWGCDECWETPVDWQKAIIDWPFHEGRARDVDLAAVGFYVV